MKSRSCALASLLALSPLFASPALAAVPIPPIETIETRMCPVGGAGALRWGQESTAQDQALLKAFSGENAPIAPFGESRDLYTQWSGKLFALEFNGASPDGDDNRAFVEGMEQQALAAGWKQAERKVTPSSLMMDARIFEKTLATADGPRLMVLEFDAPGAVILRCGDLETLRLHEDEGLEQLAPGSPRPVLPAAPAGSPGSLRTEDCTRPEIRDNLLKLMNDGRPDVTGVMDQASALERYQTRLRTWLRWKIVGSGKTDGQALWEIEDKSAPRTGDQIEEEFIGLAQSITAIDAARKKRDAEAECRALVGMIAAMARDTSSEATRLAKVNAALEEEARRLGVAID